MYNTFTQNINRGYTLEPCCPSSSNESSESMFWMKMIKIPQFYFIKWCKGLYISGTSFPDVIHLPCLCAYLMKLSVKTQVPSNLKLSWSSVPKVFNFFSCSAEAEHQYPRLLTFFHAQLY